MNILNIDNPKPYMNRAVKTEIRFDVPGTWLAMRAAERWCFENGFDYGSSCAMKPIAIVTGDYTESPLPHKWKNFKKEHFKFIEGTITGDLREGPVTVRIFA